MIFVPFKSNAPGAIDMNTITLWASLKAMEVEARNVQLRKGLCLIQGLKPSQNSPLQIRPDFSGMTSFKQFSQPFVLETFDHTKKNVSYSNTLSIILLQGYETPPVEPFYLPLVFWFDRDDTLRLEWYKT